MKTLVCLLSMSVILSLYGPLGAQVAVDSTLTDYKPVAGVSGSIKSVGSDTMNNMMALWGEGFRRYYPNVRIEVEGKGSSTAPPALISGTATFGPMSRSIKPDEVDQFEKKYGYKPLQLPTSIDMLAVYVHKDNPLPKLTMAQVDAIFSATRKLGYEEDITRWGELGLEGRFGNAPISLYGRNSASGTYGFFKETALGKGDYRDSVKEQPGSSAVVQACATDLFGIGYSGVGYKTADVRTVPLAKDDQAEAVDATAENAYSGAYPLGRYLWLTVNHKPGSKLDPLRREFIRYVFSKQGQMDVVKDGYYPVTGDIAKKSLKLVNIDQ